MPVSNVSKTRKFYIGCSGYYYPSWKNAFYPPKLPTAKWLEHYSSVFNTVELNGTFYRAPKIADLKKQHDRTPDDFKFSVKINKYITHNLRLKDSVDFISEFVQLAEEGLGNKLHKLLFQMPPSFHYTPENLGYILDNVPPGKRQVIEFRHQSWWDAEVFTALRKRKIIFCNVDYPGLQNKFVNTTSDFYLRLHGVPQLFKSFYSDEQLEAFKASFPESDAYTVYFNNTYYDAGYKNAKTLMEICNIKR
ncbi:MAG: DUF72 domain-containing protein [Bacteroidia bacterium]